MGRSTIGFSPGGSRDQPRLSERGRRIYLQDIRRAAGHIRSGNIVTRTSRAKTPVLDAQQVRLPKESLLGGFCLSRVPNCGPKYIGDSHTAPAFPELKPIWQLGRLVHIAQGRYSNNNIGFSEGTVGVESGFVKLPGTVNPKPIGEG